MELIFIFKTKRNVIGNFIAKNHAFIAGRESNSYLIITKGIIYFLSLIRSTYSIMLYWYCQAMSGSGNISESSKYNRRTGNKIIIK